MHQKEKQVRISPSPSYCHIDIKFPLLLSPVVTDKAIEHNPHYFKLSHRSSHGVPISQYAQIQIMPMVRGDLASCYTSLTWQCIAVLSP